MSNAVHHQSGTVRHKPRLLSDNGSCYISGDLEQQIGSFVEYYNNERYHESLNNVTPADVFFGRDKSIIRKRAHIKKQAIQKQAIQKRRLQHQNQTA